VVARWTGGQGVAGSNPVSPTKAPEWTFIVHQELFVKNDYGHITKTKRHVNKLASIPNAQKHQRVQPNQTFSSNFLYIASYIILENQLAKTLPRKQGSYMTTRNG